MSLGAQPTRPRRTAPPVVLSRFVGRRAELAELTELLGDRRLVTIVGPGGCGKTRLAIETLAALDGSTSDAVGWVDLAPVSDPGRVAEAAAEALGVLVGPGVDPSTALISGLRDHRGVICFDNCEHVLPTCGEVVEGLLEACPEISVLTTSRERLAVVGETLWQVPSMAADEVVELFAERARAVRTDFAVDDRNRDAVHTVCGRLDGIPLAVELAAAWVRILTPAQIATALDDRFRLLTGGGRTVLPRQQTLAASVEWSYGLLREPARTLLRRLSVFSGGFTLDAAEAVCSDDTLPGMDVLDALGRLVDTSIVVVGDRAGDAARFHLPETLRQFAAERLDEAGESSRLSDRHLEHFLAIAERSIEAFDHGDQDEARHVLEIDQDNLRAALTWALSSPHRHVEGRRLAATLARWWFVRGDAADGIDSLRRALDAAPDDRSPVQIDLYTGLALMAIPAGRLTLLHDAAARARELAAAGGDERTAARATAIAAYESWYTDYERALALAVEAQQGGEATGDEFAVRLGMLIEAVTLGNLDRYDEVFPIADALFARSGPGHDRLIAAFARQVAMYGEVLTGDVRRGLELGREAVAIAEPLGDYLIAGTTVSSLAWASGLAGLVDEGLRMMDDLVRVIEDAGPDVDVIDMHVTVGTLHLFAGHLDDAVTWLARAAEFAVGDTTDTWTSVRALPSLAGAYRRLGRLDEATAAAERGVAMARRLGTTHAYAESLDELALALASVDPARSLELHHAALAARVVRGLRTHMSDSLDGLGHLAASSEAYVDAARLFAASDAARTYTGCPRPVVDDPSHLSAVTALRAALGDAAYEEAYAEGARLTLDEAVAHVRRARGARQRPKFGWSSLTPTERSVVALVAEGLTNPQIAECLFVSRATVKTHLSNVFAKVGVTTRAQLAALAVTRHSGHGDGD